MLVVHPLNLSSTDCKERWFGDWMHSNEILCIFVRDVQRLE